MMHVLWRETLGSQLNTGQLGVGVGGAGGLSGGSGARQRRGRPEHRAPVSAPSPAGASQGPISLAAVYRKSDSPNESSTSVKSVFLQEGGEKERNWASVAAGVHCEAMTARLKHPLNECIRNGGRPRKKGWWEVRGGGVRCRDSFLLGE